MATSTQPTSNAAPQTTAGELIKALNHPIRRSVLRFLQKTGAATSTQIRNGIPDVVRNNLNHHLEILVITGAVTRGRQTGIRASIYSPLRATQVQWFQKALQLTAAED